MSTAVRLAPFNLPQIQALTDHDDMDLYTLGEKKVALYAVIPDNDNTFNFLVSLLYAQAFQALYYSADQIHHGPLPRHVRFVLDEFAAMPLPGFTRELATMRSRSISASVIIQNMAQIKELYKDSWETIPGNCDTILYLGGNESSTHKYVSEMLGKVFGAGAINVTYTLMVLAVSVFCLTSLDTATRLARYMFQEFWLKPGEKVSDPTVTGARKVLCNPYVSTAITVVLGIALGMTGYAKIWPLFGAANQLLAGLGLLAVAAWLGKMGRNNKMFIFPMIFMILVTLTSLVFTIKAQIVGIIAGGQGVAWFYIRGILAVLLVILAIDLVVEGGKAIASNSKKAEQA